MECYIHQEMVVDLKLLQHCMGINGKLHKHNIHAIKNKNNAIKNISDMRVTLLLSVDRMIGIIFKNKLISKSSLNRNYVKINIHKM